MGALTSKFPPYKKVNMEGGNSKFIVPYEEKDFDIHHEENIRRLFSVLEESGFL